MGAASPLGKTVAENVEGFKAGRMGMRGIDFFDVAGQRVKTAGIVQMPDLAGVECRLSDRERSGLDRGTRMLLGTGHEAMAAAGLTISDRTMPVVIGTSAAAMAEGEAYYRQAIAPDGSRRGQFRHVERYQPQHQATLLMRALGIGGRATVLSNACASGANALGHGFQLVANGRADRVLAGGFDALCQLVFAGFDSLQALAPSGIPRPFDAARDGLALGEGGAMMVLESPGSARARGVAPLARLCGYGMALDTHHLTQPHPEGDAALASMRQACANAGVAPEEVAYLSSHGTGTPLNDVAEANAIRRWAGDAVGGVRVSSTKSSTGHLLGGAGALEAAICVMAMCERFLPANLNVREPDPAVVFDLVREPRLDVSVPVTLTNSFGFGGANATLIFRAA